MKRILATMLMVGCLAARAAVADDRPLTMVDANAGKLLYMQHCSACHGERGNGAGPAAAFLDPRPRDFTKRVFSAPASAASAATLPAPAFFAAAANSVGRVVTTLSGVVISTVAITLPACTGRKI